MVSTSYAARSESGPKPSGHVGEQSSHPTLQPGGWRCKSVRDLSLVNDSHGVSCFGNCITGGDLCLVKIH